MRIVRYAALVGALFFLVAGTCVDPGSDLVTARAYATATMLRSGDVLVVGGVDADGNSLASAELFHPDSGEWTSAGDLSAARVDHTATLLSSGKVLVAGGWNIQSGKVVPAAELYDPASNSWSSAGLMKVGRDTATATLLPSGKVLVAGGEDEAGAPIASAELYDPTTNGWSEAALMTTPRIGHTATLLPSGKVLVVGGEDLNGDPIGDAELYDPAMNTWSGGGTLGTAREFHTATLLPSGKVFVAGGYDVNDAPTNSTEIFDPANGWTSFIPLADARAEHTATLAPNGDVVLLGGFGTQGDPGGEVVDVANGTTASDPSLDLHVEGSTATLLPSGRILVVGGEDNSSEAVVTTVSAVLAGTGEMVPTGAMNEARAGHTGTLLPNGQVLVTGGVQLDSSGELALDGGVLASAELFDPQSETWTETGPLATPRFSHTATSLTDGGVLVVGGYTDGGAVIGTAEQFDFTKGTWTSIAPMGTARAAQSATRLHSGQVLVVGGVDAQGQPLATAELYDPRTGSWSATSPLAQARAAHSATLLPSGQVLVVGGVNAGGPLATAEKYNPTTRTWSAAGAMNAPMEDPTATLLANGRVLVSVGSNAQGPQDIQVYDPASNLWADTGIEPEGPPVLSLVPTGDALFASLIGGPLDALYNFGLNALDDFDGPSGQAGLVATAPHFAQAQAQGPGIAPILVQLQTSTRLVSGKVLVAGGVAFFASGATAVAGLYEEGADDAWRPTLVSPGSVLAGQIVTLNGTLFEGVSPGSSGTTTASPGGVPRFTLYSLLTQQTRDVPVSRYTDTSADVTLPQAPPGRYILSVCVNAICNGTWLDLQSTGQPFADDQTLDVPSATGLSVTLSATDPQGLPLTYSVVAAPLHGALTGTAPSLTYTPTSGYAGADRFTFQASNGKSASNVATISLNVQAGTPPPVAVSRKLTTFQNTAIPATLVVNGAPGSSLTYSVVASPKHGKLSGTAPKLTYTPDEGYTGTDGFTFQASDGTLTSNVATVSIVVSAAKDPVAPPSPYVSTGCASTGTSGGLAGLGLLALLVGLALRRRGAHAD